MKVSLWGLYCFWVMWSGNWEKGEGVVKEERYGWDWREEKERCCWGSWE